MTALWFVDGFVVTVVFSGVTAHTLPRFERIVRIETMASSPRPLSTVRYGVCICLIVHDHAGITAKACIPLVTSVVNYVQFCCCFCWRRPRRPQPTTWTTTTTTATPAANATTTTTTMTMTTMKMTTTTTVTATVQGLIQAMPFVQLDVKAQSINIVQHVSSLRIVPKPEAQMVVRCLGCRRLAADAFSG